MARSVQKAEVEPELSATSVLRIDGPRKTCAQGGDHHVENREPKVVGFSPAGSGQAWWEEDEQLRAIQSQLYKLPIPVPWREVQTSVILEICVAAKSAIA